MRRRAVSGIMLTLLLVGMSTLTSNMQPAKASLPVIQDANVNIHNSLRGVGPSGESAVGYGFGLFIHTLEDPGEVSPEEILLEVIAEGVTHILSIAEVEILGWTDGLFCIKARGHFEEDDPTIEPILGEYQVSVRGSEPFHICELGDIPKDAPEVLYPEHGQSIVDTTPVFEWEVFLSDYLGGLVFPWAYEINIIFPDDTWLTAFPIDGDQTSLDYLTADWDSEEPPELGYGLYSLIIHSNHRITDGLAFQHHRIIDFYVAPVEIGPTSLEVWTEIDSVEVGDSFAVCGRIYIKNDPEYPAYIPEVWDCIEAKSGRDGWTILAREMVIEYDSLMIAPGETAEIMFRITFANCWKAYRNVVLVRLLNHPTGERWFHYRESFEVPVPEC